MATSIVFYHDFLQGGKNKYKCNTFKHYLLCGFQIHVPLRKLNPVGINAGFLNIWMYSIGNIDAEHFQINL